MYALKKLCFFYTPINVWPQMVPEKKAPVWRFAISKVLEIEFCNFDIRSINQIILRMWNFKTIQYVVIILQTSAQTYPKSAISKLRQNFKLQCDRSNNRFVRLDLPVMFSMKLLHHGYHLQHYHFIPNILDCYGWLFFIEFILPSHVYGIWHHGLIL